MKAVARRLRILEDRLAPQDIGGATIADTLRARRRRRCQESGLPYQEPTRDPILYANGRRPTLAEILRNRRARRIAACPSGMATDIN